MQTRGITCARAGHITCNGGHIIRNNRGISCAEGGAYHVQKRFSKYIKHIEITKYFYASQNRLIFFNPSLIIKDIGRQREKEKEDEQTGKPRDRFNAETTIKTANDNFQNPFHSKKTIRLFEKRMRSKQIQAILFEGTKSLAANSHNHYSGEAHA